MNKLGGAFFHGLLALFALNLVLGSEALCQSAGKPVSIEAPKRKEKSLYATLTSMTATPS